MNLGEISQAVKFVNELTEFSGKMASNPRFELNFDECWPVLNDNTENTEFDRQYVYHLAWAARVLRELQPEEHVDISSALYFSVMMSAFIPVKFYDLRPAEVVLDDLATGKANLTDLPFADGSIASLSCMHVVEHSGLGRYGDAIDPEGDLRAIAELKRVLAKGGSLLFVVPIGGRPRIQFNAHRIYSYAQIVEYFGDLDLVDFALIPEHARDGGLIFSASQAQSDKENYACGCFWFRKPL